MNMYPYNLSAEEMRQRCYSTDSIREGEKADRICQLIEDAFAGVKLDYGVSLRQARALDDWADDAECARVRTFDEHDDWHRVSIADLNEYASTLIFFDPKGVCFYLPALLIADLRGRYKHNVIDRFLNSKSNRREVTFEFLSPQQRNAVRAFLEFIADVPEFSHERTAIQNEITNYWSTL